MKIYVATILLIILSPLVITLEKRIRSSKTTFKKSKILGKSGIKTKTGTYKSGIEYETKFPVIIFDVKGGEHVPKYRTTIFNDIHIREKKFDAYAERFSVGRTKVLEMRTLDGNDHQ